MYSITPELKTDGFSVHPINIFIEKNYGNRTFNTMDNFCIYLVINKVQLLINNKNYEVEGGNFIFVAPGTDITYGTECEEQNHIYAITFTAGFYEKSATDSYLLNSELFFNNDIDVYITPSTATIEEIKKLFIDRLSMYKDKKSKGLYIAMAHNCVEILILNGLYFIEESKAETIGSYIQIDTANKFRVLLQKEYKNSRKVKYYAEALHITPRRLTEITESCFGKTAKQIIIDKIVSESTRILKHTNFTISEVAHDLGFSDEGNFSAFYKKHTSNNPSELQKNKDEVISY